MTRTRWILVAASVAASLAALAIVGCGGSDNGLPAVVGASATRAIAVACELGGVLTLSAGLLAAAIPTPKGRT